ncbi:terpene cyclase/mutase family protein [Rubinisphaera italica]|uniref:Squalene--hopene cyclase n=1 Tax=Rubinisphaera italica TaxID=2527969 RepID=A0A5C5XG24_9PLAN|nr:prenyltransferase/squalene oxidase repeat-containing protein [Rubinisphaera italica]TWT62086.1 Squalene--hopene cyclase [Rubinisphaera italica]
MESGRPDARFAQTDFNSGSAPEFPVSVNRSEFFGGDQNDPSPLGKAISATAQFLKERQHAEGFWVAELEGDTILESEYILLLAYLGEENSESAKAAAAYIVEQQCSHDGWALFPNGPLEISASVKAYWALKITGHAPEAEYMQRAREAILAAGGAEKVNSFTRYYMALLGLISYHQCPAVPPELVLLPRWTRLSIYDMSAWSRTILMPLSLLWAYKPHRDLPEEQQIEELFIKSARKLPICNDVTEKVDDLSYRSRIPWAWMFRQFDRGYKLIERCGGPPLRNKSIRIAAGWILERLQNSDGLGAIFPPIVWSLVALKSLGFEDDSYEVVTTRQQLDALILQGKNAQGEKTVRLQPCKSPVWDTSIATLALAETGQADCKEAVAASSKWMRAQEIRSYGDWSITHRDVEPGGWCFEFNNEFYPDVDDTAMVLMALLKSLPDDLHADWLAELVPQSERSLEKRLSTIVSGKSEHWQSAMSDVSRLQPSLDAFRRGVQWLLAMQSKNGGWGAFDSNNDFELLTRVPFADHNAMIDPPTPDITARVLEALAMLGVNSQHEAIQKALTFLWEHQEEDGSWPGRWGVNYIYGTWQVVVGLIAVGISPEDARIQKSICWLKARQQANGGWGETPESYDRPELKGTGVETPSQTAWAILALVAAGESHSTAVSDAVRYLIETQQADGSWNETEFTGTGFPKVFYLRYHYYRIYFPLLALARYRQAARITTPS